jgi:hypothetical protein
MRQSELPASAVVAASRALVVPPPVVFTRGDTVTSVTVPILVMLMPAAFALACIAADSWVMLMDELVRTGSLWTWAKASAIISMTMRTMMSIERRSTSKRGVAQSVLLVSLSQNVF